MEELIAVIARSLVDKPEAVKVTSKDEDDNVTIELSVAPEDLGKVIGKGGRTAQAMRTILSGASGKLKGRCILEIVE